QALTVGELFQIAHPRRAAGQMRQALRCDVNRRLRSSHAPDRELRVRRFACVLAANLVRVVMDCHQVAIIFVDWKQLRLVMHWNSARWSAESPECIRKAPPGECLPDNGGAAGAMAGRLANGP